ncbi:hypothetical protein [Pseudoalteromonas xiamenensis]|uniref:Uncharacterized protein n=1 Tax=Pseudoalteromonas xiamenensis TaxID=882626 RepID=A0A975HMJ7_9GAMM|nr:hypothetical protein [Pseudoalteromonas xiamenensis]QTH73196.1 hypothetical protein J5O05_20610 [Pseudoalteromonas xiamenensis]WMN62064.1 hypothetical protein NI389_19900 [Pseudoalteromonas xiamenensis]
MLQIEAQRKTTELTFIETESYLDKLLVEEVANSDDLKSILGMLLFDDTLSSQLKRQVERQLKQLKGCN